MLVPVEMFAMLPYRIVIITRISNRGDPFVSSWNGSFQKPHLGVVDNLSSVAHKETRQMTNLCSET